MVNLNYNSDNDYLKILANDTNLLLHGNCKLIRHSLIQFQKIIWIVCI